MFILRLTRQNKNQRTPPLRVCVSNLVVVTKITVPFHFNILSQGKKTYALPLSLSLLNLQAEFH